jgi:hypothetical protein
MKDIMNVGLIVQFGMLKAIVLATILIVATEYGTCIKS